MDVSALACAICFEAIAASDGIDSTPCAAPHEHLSAICCACLTHHIAVSLNSTFRGLLPRIRCPICLMDLEKAQWQPFVLNQELMHAYARLCQRACGFQTPCCHLASYTHLPSLPEGPNEIALCLHQAKLPALDGLLALYYARKISSRCVVDYLLQNIGRSDSKELDLVLKHALAQSSDEERRATLLLSFLHQVPQIWTRCCLRPMCFNCKRVGHHDICETQDLDELKCLVQCRQCRVTIIKVEGCDLVACPCGFAIHWQVECRYRDLSKKRMLPVDLFDLDHFRDWETWQLRFRRVSHDIARAVGNRLMRERVERWLAVYQVVLEPIWRKYVMRRRCRPVRAKEDMLFSQSKTTIGELILFAVLLLGSSFFVALIMVAHCILGLLDRSVGGLQRWFYLPRRLGLLAKQVPIEAF